jgi:hypothetical protein
MIHVYTIYVQVCTYINRNSSSPMCSQRVPLLPLLINQSIAICNYVCISIGIAVLLYVLAARPTERAFLCRPHESIERQRSPPFSPYLREVPPSARTASMVDAALRHLVIPTTQLAASGSTEASAGVGVREPSGAAMAALSCTGYGPILIRSHCLPVSATP